MRFLSNFGCEIIFMCSVNFWHQQDSNSLFKGSIGHVTTSSNLQEEIENVDIVPAIRTDHSAITLHVNGIDETAKGPSCWKFKASLVALINEKYEKWLEEGVEIQEPPNNL